MNKRTKSQRRIWSIFGGLVMGNCLLIVALLLLSGIGHDEPSSNQKTATGIAGTNLALEGQYNATLTALSLIEQATQTQIRADEMTGTP